MNLFLEEKENHIAGDLKVKETQLDQIENKLSINKSKRNHGNHIEGPWVFGLVRQTKSIIEKNKIASALLEVERKNTVMSIYPNDKYLKIKFVNKVFLLLNFCR